MTTHAANDSLELDQPGLGLALPIARVHGEPMTEMPADLYIPPEALSVFLEAFEGPLDLLLYLIRRHSLDITLKGLKAARDYSPKDAVGIDGALQRLLQHSYGTAALIVVACGLVAFGAYRATRKADLPIGSRCKLASNTFAARRRRAISARRKFFSP